MKRIWVIILCVIFLCGCKNSDELDKALLLRQNLVSCQECQMECLITADYGEKFYEFSLDCLYDKDGNMQFEVLKPESIAGITGFVSNDGGMLTFDDQALAFPLLADGYLSPVSAPWLFMRSLRSGYINACGPDGEGYLMELTDSFEEKPIQIFVWTDQNFQPVRGEMIWSGRRILSLDVIHISYV